MQGVDQCVAKRLNGEIGIYLCLKKYCYGCWDENVSIWARAFWLDDWMECLSLCGAAFPAHSLWHKHMS